MPAWNEVVIQSVLYGLDMCPDTHREQGNTIVELTGTHEKLDQVLTRVREKQDVDVLAVIESKLVDQCK